MDEQKVQFLSAVKQKTKFARKQPPLPLQEVAFFLNLFKTVVVIPSSAYKNLEITTIRNFCSLESLSMDISFTQNWKVAIMPHSVKTCLLFREPTILPPAGKKRRVSSPLLGVFFKKIGRASAERQGISEANSKIQYMFYEK